MKQKFGLDKLVVTTSPITPVTPDNFDSLRTPTSNPDHLITPTAKTYHTMSSHNQNTEQGKPASTSSSTTNPYFPRQVNNVPNTSARIRNPAPPSPLSRIQTSPGDGLSRSLPTPSSTTVPSAGGANLVPQSPCFIHSHLDRTGTLQNWLQAGDPHGAGGSSSGAGGGIKRASGPIPSSRQGPALPHVASSSRHPRIPVHQARQAASQAGSLPDINSTGSSRVTSPNSKPEPSLSGYESDKSSILGGSALFDGDFMDDDDDTGSLTRQLAETAQGVREMSKQLGKLASFRDGDKRQLTIRSYTCPIQDPDCAHCHQSPRQSSHQAHSRTCTLSHAKTTNGPFRQSQ
jgi:NAD+ kinase